MKHKIISIVGALTLTAGVFGAIAAEPTLVRQPTIEEGVNVCRVAFAQTLKGDRGKAFKEALDILPDKTYKQAQAMICYAYVEGFKDGVNYEGE